MMEGTVVPFVFFFFLLSIFPSLWLRTVEQAREMTASIVWSML